VQGFKVFEVVTDEDKFREMFSGEGDEKFLNTLIEDGEFMNMRYIMGTLTIRNVHGADGLKKARDELSEGWNRLTKYKEFKEVGKVWIRSFEYTRNDDKHDKEWYGSYHLHAHFLMGVPKYLLPEHMAKLTDKWMWIRLLRRAMKLDYDPWVKVHEVYKRNGQTYQGALCEVLKYTVKGSEYLHKDPNVTDKVVKELLEAVRGMRVVGTCRLLSEIKKRLKLQDLEAKNADLVGATDKKEGLECLRCLNGALIEVEYEYQYEEKEYRKIVLEKISDESDRRDNAEDGQLRIEDLAVCSVAAG
jgi:plasmid rolling circle replication initiator protein Rep